MSGALLTIGKSGALAARAALELAGQNIANAGNGGYTRRTLGLGEIVATGGIGLTRSTALGGVRASGVERAEAQFLHTEARRTGSDLARAQAEVGGLRAAEAALEQSGLYPAITSFEASLTRLSADPLDGALRADALEQARTLTQGFGLAARGLDSAMEAVRVDTASSVAEVNRIAGELARTNVGLARVQDGSAGKAVLLDQRDALLAGLAGQAGFASEFDAAGRVAVRLGGAGGPLLVSGSAAANLTVTEAAGGVLQYAVNGATLQLGSGALAGQAQALGQMSGAAEQLDDLAAVLVARSNAAQGMGITPAGAAGGPLFNGNNARDIAVALADGAGLATAPAGSGPGSRDTGNLDALRAALATDGPAAGADRLLFTLSSAIAGREVTRGVLQTLSDTAGAALHSQTGVDLDAEAANLLRFQQAFQASGRVMQAAAEIFDTMLGIGR